jgi:hypothetical protein
MEEEFIVVETISQLTHTQPVAVGHQQLTKQLEVLSESTRSSALAEAQKLNALLNSALANLRQKSEEEACESKRNIQSLEVRLLILQRQFDELHASHKHLSEELDKLKKEDSDCKRHKPNDCSVSLDRHLSVVVTTDREFITSLILGDSSKLLTELKRMLPLALVLGSLRLIYRGSRDGFSASVFHQRCDGFADCVLLLRSNKGVSGGNIFGCFSGSNAFTSDGGYASSSGAFLFALRQAQTACEGAVKLTLKNPADACTMCNSPEYGPTFGYGHDLRLAGNMQSERAMDPYNSCYPSSFVCVDPAFTNVQVDSRLLAGAAQLWRVEEIEVFARCQ